MKKKTIFQTLFAFFLSVTTMTASTAKPNREMPTIHPALWPTTSGGVAIDPVIEARIEALMATMTVEELVGQTIQADIDSITPAEVRQYRLGSVLNGGNSAPGSNMRAPAAEWLALVDEFYAASMDTSEGGKAIPLLWGTDAVHGHNNIVGATIFPHNIGLGATRNPDLIREIGTVTAREMVVTGMDWTFAPTLAVVRNARWGRTYEGYAEDPALVADYATAIVQGLQGPLNADVNAANTFLGPEQVLATAKHFLGDGGTRHGRDQGDNVDSEADLRDLHGAGYIGAIDAGVQTVMASFSSWHGQKMHGHYALLTDVLKTQMGFNGFVVGDWNGHGQIPGCTNSNCPAALNAGIDMFMAPDSWRKLYKNTVAQVKSGEISRARLEDAVRRILRVKFRLGLFEKPKPSNRPLAGEYSLLGAPLHLAVAQQAVRESLVLLKNHENILPLSAQQRILVAGDAADDIGQQSGGWTYSWQGTGNTNADFPNGTSIWAGIRSVVEAQGGEAILSPDGRYRSVPDVAIVVFGETPYAEFRGDVDHLDFESTQGLQLLQSFQSAGIPTVAIFLSGRPLWVNPEINASDAFVAAWLPGTQGGAMADVLFRQADGTVNDDFRGKLSFSWPRSASPAEANRNAPDYEPLFPYGYGLTYAEQGDLPQLSEAPGRDGERRPRSVFFTQGEAVRPLSLQGATSDLSLTVINALTQVEDALTIRSIDRAAQEDAKQLTWSGTERASVKLTGPATDYSPIVPGQAIVLTFQYRVDSPPLGPVTFFLDCGDNCRADLDITHLFTGVDLDHWTQAEINLSCLPDVDLTKVTTVFGIETSDQLSVSLSEVRLPSHERIAPCLTD